MLICFLLSVRLRLKNIHLHSSVKQFFIPFGKGISFNLINCMEIFQYFGVATLTSTVQFISWQSAALFYWMCHFGICTYFHIFEKMSKNMLSPIFFISRENRLVMRINLDIPIIDQISFNVTSYTAFSFISKLYIDEHHGSMFLL